MSHKDLIQERQMAIRALIQQYIIEDQQALSQLLATHYKIKVNQAIISRDLRALGVFKIPKDGKSVYRLPDTPIALQILNLGIENIQYNDNMVVIKTLGGLAAFVGDFLDALEDQNILGTLAGENTVFVTPVAGIAIEVFYRSICSATSYGRGDPTTSARPSTSTSWRSCGTCSCS